jgi:hypothetical protein
VRVLKSRDGQWRAEEHRDGWRLFRHGGLILDRASLDRLAAELLENAVVPDDLQAD